VAAQQGSACALLIVLSCYNAGWICRQHCPVVWQQNDDQLVLCVLRSVFLGKYLMLTAWLRNMAGFVVVFSPAG